MNITDFVDSIKLQLSDLMNVGDLGYVEGISTIIVKNLCQISRSVGKGRFALSRFKNLLFKSGRF